MSTKESATFAHFSASVSMPYSSAFRLRTVGRHPLRRFRTSKVGLGNGLKTMKSGNSFEPHLQMTNSSGSTRLMKGIWTGYGGALKRRSWWRYRLFYLEN